MRKVILISSLHYYHLAKPIIYWILVIEEPHLKYKSDKIVENYHKLWGKEASIYDQYIARVSSVFLETFLFYSGFYYPLYLAGQGKNDYVR